MKKVTFSGITLLSLLAFFALSAFTILNGTWKNDPAHSQLGFTVTHLGISDVSGTFNDFNVEVKSSKPDFSDASFELNAKTASIDTRVEARNKHLKSADFFDAEKYPNLTFKSTSLKKAGKNQFKLAGDLTIHGVTKPVVLDLTYNGTVENQMSKKATAGFSLSGTIKRSDFSIGSKFPAPMISDEVRINASGEFTQN
ncbi:YceI family protein [Desertivirga xinjiangensis]|uniref:YceI family protein n=1 Tax=Desertivirga xinjiangensis TaxID=539206 RepID=UPI00210A54AF|nr:YceI family protein [Pedobacter xinjiangensis]